jgi:hypothetical protein
MSFADLSAEALVFWTILRGALLPLLLLKYTLTCGIDFAFSTDDNQFARLEDQDGTPWVDFPHNHCREPVKLYLERYDFWAIV